MHIRYNYYTEGCQQISFLELYLFLHSDHVLKLLVLLTACIAVDETRMQPSTTAESMKYTARGISY